MICWGRGTGGLVARILVVDDEPNIREIVGLYLRRDGHAVVEAADGEEEDRTVGLSLDG